MNVESASSYCKFLTLLVQRGTMCPHLFQKFFCHDKRGLEVRNFQFIIIFQIIKKIGFSVFWDDLEGVPPRTQATFNSPALLGLRELDFKHLEILLNIL